MANDPSARLYRPVDGRRAAVELDHAPEPPDAPAARRDAAWAVDHETVAWTTEPDRTLSRRMQRISRGDYQASVPPPIARLAVTLEPDVAAESVEAAMAVVRFDEEMSRRLKISDDDEVSPLDAVLLRTESASSSQIEKITANARSLALASIGEHTGPNAQLVVSNSKAMRAALEMADDIGVETIINAHTALLGDSAPDLTGSFRKDAVWIGGRGSTPHSADFVPPQAPRVAELMGDLIEFSVRTDVAPMAQAALAHAQFETIHPFPDGNGRVGRVLVHAMLRAAGVTKRMTLPVSSGLLADIDGYYSALTAYRAGDLNPIVVEFSEASLRSIDNGRALVDDLSEAHGRWVEAITARRDAAVYRALPLVISQPAVTVSYLAERLGISNTAAERAVAQMEAAGVLTPHGARQRSRVWTAPDVTTALDAFARRAGRRVFHRG